MIIQCHSCGIRYLLDDDVLGSRGCHVRCTACGTIWHQSAAPLPQYALVKRTEDPTEDTKTANHSSLFWISIACIIALTLGAALFALSKNYFIGAFPKIRDLYSLLNFKSDTHSVEIISFSFKKDVQNSALLCHGILHNTSKNTIKSPILMLAFAKTSPTEKHAIEKIYHTLSHITLNEKESCIFSFTLPNIPKDSSFISAIVVN
jgi:predicted Zn finger-like uncharacterized protein